MIPRLIAAKHLDDVTDRRVPSDGVLTKEIWRRSLQNRERAAKLLMVEQQGVSGIVTIGLKGNRTEVVASRVSQQWSKTAQ